MATIYFYTIHPDGSCKSELYPMVNWQCTFKSQLASWPNTNTCQVLLGILSED